jgi:DNA polymerase-3 subunit epsilon
MLPWPLAVIDFEASSLDQDGYPIEVGLALWPSPDQAILGWSTLIQPAGEWTRRGHWSLKSAKVHGILGRDLLAHGQPVNRVAAALNEALGHGTIAWCDGDAYDIHWTGALFKAANIAPVFTLGQWHRLIAMLGPAMRERGLHWLEQAQARHRARADAEQLLVALAYAAEIEVGPAQDLDQRLPALAALTTPNGLLPGTPASGA